MQFIVTIVHATEMLNRSLGLFNKSFPTPLINVGGSDKISGNMAQINFALEERGRFFSLLKSGKVCQQFFPWW